MIHVKCVTMASSRRLFMHACKVTINTQKQETRSPYSHVHFLRHRRPDLGFNTRQRVQSKSILRDPICEALRAQVKTGMLETNSPLEAEIDDLLFGGNSSGTSRRITSPAMDSVIILQDVPYVSMIEVKYRSRSSHLPAPSAASVATPSPSSTTYTTSSNYSRSMDSS